MKRPKKILIGKPSPSVAIVASAARSETVGQLMQNISEGSSIEHKAIDESLGKTSDQWIKELKQQNKELVLQNTEKGMRIAELTAEVKGLVLQSHEKEKEATALITINNELEAFTYESSHDLQEPLRKIQFFALRILETESQNLSEKGRDYLKRMQKATARMQHLIDDLLAFSHLSIAERKYEDTDLNKIVAEVEIELKENIDEKKAIIEASELCTVNIIAFQFHQLMHNLISNALKFSRPEHPPHIVIKSRIERGKDLGNEKLLADGKYCHVSVSDNGIGFDQQYADRIFQVFQQLHRKEVFGGTGIGLAIVKKVVENHKGLISVISKINEGATFNIYIPISDGTSEC